MESGYLNTITIIILCPSMKRDTLMKRKRPTKLNQWSFYRIPLHLLKSISLSL